MSDEAKFMLKEFYISIAKNHGSPRIRETIVTIAKMVSRLKLKNTIDAEDAKEAMEFYNVILQQLDQIVNVTTDPSNETFECCISVLQESSFAILFEEVIKSDCTKNDRVRHYIGEKFKLRENKKLRPILGRLRNHSHIRIVNEKPVALKWVSDNNNYTSQRHLEDSSNTVLTTKCAPCDQCDPNPLHIAKIQDTISEGMGKVEEGSEKEDSESMRSHRAHRSQSVQRLALRHSSAAIIMSNNDLEDSEDVAIESSRGESA
jgi:hypothetical protein